MAVLKPVSSSSVFKFFIVVVNLTLIWRAYWKFHPEYTVTLPLLRIIFIGPDLNFIRRG